MLDKHVFVLAITMQHIEARHNAVIDEISAAYNHYHAALALPSSRLLVRIWCRPIPASLQTHRALTAVQNALAPLCSYRVRDEGNLQWKCNRFGIL